MDSFEKGMMTIFMTLFIGAGTLYFGTMYIQNSAVEKAIAAGVDPLAARCAFKDRQACMLMKQTPPSLHQQLNELLPNVR